MVENVVNRDFSPAAPNKVWVTDITYIRTYEGWTFLAVIVDLRVSDFLCSGFGALSISTG